MRLNVELAKLPIASADRLRFAAGCLVAISLAGCTKDKQQPVPAPATQKAATKPSTPLENRTPDDAYGRPASVSQPSGSPADPARTSVPASAQLVGGGTGELKYTAETNGTLFLVNAETGFVMFQGRVAKGQNVKLDPVEQVLQIENKTVVKQVGRYSQTRKMFFQRD